MPQGERKRLDAKTKALESVIYSALFDEDGSTADVLGHSLAVGTRRTYEYSPAVDRMADELAALKRYGEEARPAACMRATRYVTVRKAPRAETALRRAA